MLGDRKSCDLYMGCVIHRHFNAEGNALLAAIVEEWIVTAGAAGAARAARAVTLTAHSPPPIAHSP